MPKTLNVLIADDDMDVNHLMRDILEISFRDVRIERAMSLKSFWLKLPLPEGSAPWDLIFLSADYIAEEPDGFAERLAAANPDASAKVIVIGNNPGCESCGSGVGPFPYLVKPFSLDRFDEVVKGVSGR